MNTMKRTHWNYQSLLRINRLTKNSGSLLNLLRIVFFLFSTLSFFGFSVGVLSWYNTESSISLLIITDESILNTTNNQKVLLGDLSNLISSKNIFQNIFNFDDTIYSGKHKIKDSTRTKLIYVKEKAVFNKDHKLVIPCRYITSPDNGNIQFDQLLSWIKSQQTENFLLVLDIFENNNELFKNRFQLSILESIKSSLEKIRPSNLNVIIPDNKGAASITIPGRDITLFNHFLVQGISGLADSLSEVPNGLVTTKDLHRYLVSRMNQWTKHFNYKETIPFTWFGDSPTMNLTHSRVNSNEDLAIPLINRDYPVWLYEAWLVSENYKRDSIDIIMPNVFNYYLISLFETERSWFNGISDSLLKERFLNTAFRIDQLIKQYSSVSKPKSYSVALKDKHLSETSVTKQKADELRLLMIDINKKTDISGLKSEEILTFINEMSEKWLTSSNSSLDLSTKSSIVINTAFSVQWKSRHILQFLVKCLGASRVDFQIEVDMLYKLYDVSNNNQSHYGIDLLNKVFKTSVLRERLLSKDEENSGLLSHFDVLLMNQHEIELIVTNDLFYDPIELDKRLDNVLDGLSSYAADQNLLSDARRALYRGFHDLSWSSKVLDLLPELDSLTSSYFATVNELYIELKNLDQQVVLNGLLNDDQSDLIKKPLALNDSLLTFTNQKIRIDQLRKKTNDLNKYFWEKFSPSALDNMLTNLQDETNQFVHVDEILTALSFPTFDSDTRKRVFSAIDSHFIKKSQNFIFSKLSPNDNIFNNKLLLEKDVSNLNQRIKIFSTFALYITPSWSKKHIFGTLIDSNKELISSPNLNYTAELLFSDWITSLRSTFFSDKDLDYNPLQALFYTLYDPQSSLSDNRCLIDQNHRLKRLSFFYEFLNRILAYYAVDLDGSTIARSASNDLRRITGHKDFDLPRISVSLENVSITENQDQAECSIHVQSVLESYRPSNTLIRFEFSTLPGSNFIVDSSPLIYRLDSKDIINKRPGYYEINLNQKILVRHVDILSKSSDLKNQNYSKRNAIMLKTFIGDTPYHSFVVPNISWPRLKPRLDFLSTFNSSQGSDRLILRPFDQIQSRQIRISNPSTDPLKVNLRLIAVDSFNKKSLELISKPLDIASQSNSIVQLQPLVASLPTNTNKPTITTPANPSSGTSQVSESKWPGSLIPVDPIFQIEIQDRSNPLSPVILKKELSFDIASPTDLVSLDSPYYEPTLKRLSVSMQPSSLYMGDKSSKIELRLPNVSTNSQGSPLMSIGGNLTGFLEYKPDQVFNIIASPVRVNPNMNGTLGRFFINIDNYERAFIFQNRWISDAGDPLRSTLVFKPELKLVVNDVVNNSQPVRIKLEPINAPDNSSLLLEFGIARGIDSSLKMSKVMSWPTSRRERFALGVDEKSGELLLSVDFGDWVYDMPTTGLVGKVTLRGSLLDMSGKIVASDTRHVLLDDQKSLASQIIGLPNQALLGSSIQVGFSTQAAPGGLKSVIAFLGPLKDNVIPQNAITSQLSLVVSPIAGSDDSSTPNSQSQKWEGQLEIPNKPELLGKSVIHVKTESNSGVIQFSDHPILIVPSDFVEPGQVSGTVLLGDISQPDLPVVLRKMDAKRTEIGRVKSDGQGHFEFKMIPPGTYGIFTAKSINRTSAQAEVIVKPGLQTNISLSLGRVGLPSNGPAPKDEPLPKSENSKASN
ncbi:MAG: hypothetical protein WCJ40_03765 [Planctomycetota bacterium]